MDLDPPPRPFLACLAVARADEEAPEPALEAVGLAKCGDVPPGGDERLLRGVPGPLAVVEDQQGDGVEPVDRLTRQLAERIVIARHRLQDQVPPHRASGIGATHSVALTG